MEEIVVIPAKDLGMAKCPRCWHFSFDKNFDNLCGDCCLILINNFPDHPSVEMIKSYAHS